MPAPNHPLSTLALLLFLAALAAAEMPTIDKVLLDRTIAGERVSVDDLRGRVVLLEFWGITWGPCLGKIPSLRRLAEEHAGTAFLLVAPHHQAATEEQVLAVCKKKGINYTVTAQGDVIGQNTLSLPIAFLFDHTGKCIEMGRNISEKTIAQAVKAAPAVTKRENAARSLLPDDEFEFEILATDAAQVRAGKDLGQVLARMRDLEAQDTDDKLDDAQIERAMLFEALETAANRQLELAMAQKEVRASNAIAALQQVADTWAGDQVAATATAEIERLGADPEWNQWLKADALLEKLERVVTLLAPCGDDHSLDLAGCERCRKANAKVVAAVGKAAKKLLADYKDTPAARGVRELLTAAGIPLQE